MEDKVTKLIEILSKETLGGNIQWEIGNTTVYGTLLTSFTNQKYEFEKVFVCYYKSVKIVIGIESNNYVASTPTLASVKILIDNTVIEVGYNCNCRFLFDLVQNVTQIKGKLNFIDIIQYNRYIENLFGI